MYGAVGGTRDINPNEKVEKVEEEPWLLDKCPLVVCPRVVRERDTGSFVCPQHVGLTTCHTGKCTNVKPYNTKCTFSPKKLRGWSVYKLISIQYVSRHRYEIYD